MAIFSGNAHPELAQDIARMLHVPLARAHVGRFSDGEIMVEIMENIRGRDVFIVQSTCAPTNDNLMELLVMVDAVKVSVSDQVVGYLAVSFPRNADDMNEARRRLREAGSQARLVAKIERTEAITNLEESLAADRPARFLRIIKAVSQPDDDLRDIDNGNVDLGSRRLPG